ncbi:MAG TPA: bifunctional UDP-N-acetylglucosamine diphosphorylase/glucosamine-1-phosphate N-acetyltransferase GlmU [Thermoanaerobaculia bacterium]|nr:bifunctional UDP-N-acetylglucosamine diphosphorylase/glucosamine-1-phosphate N-acetyltransferase GlmU [Thermoanaerobaculia bacterium]
MNRQELEVVILAAGLGTRMKSSKIKILHRAAGRPLIDYVLDTAAAVGARTPIMVVGHQADDVREAVGDRARYALQEPQRGTGHAAMQAAALLKRDASAGCHVLILSGDAPLVRPETLQRLIETHEREENALTVLSMKPPEAGAYGRVVRDDEGAVVRIVELKDATDDERRIAEVNAGIYVFAAQHLLDNLGKLSTDNAQNEYYLTDLIAMIRDAGHRVGAEVAPDPTEAIGVNSRAELATVEAEIQRRVVERMMRDGVTFRNPSTIVIDSTVTIGPDTVVYPFVTIEGTTAIGRDCVIEPFVHLENATVGNNVHLLTGTVVEEAAIGDDASVGPYARLRPGSVLGRGVRIGNFVETKNAVFGEGSKALHLSYIGDAEVGTGVNIGAGTITCNFDGFKKHKTIIEDEAFIGSDTQLVAPVTVGKGAFIGAGSTITEDVPAGALAMSRVPQRVIEDWVKKRRERK